MNNKIKPKPKSIKGIPDEVFREAMACKSLLGIKTIGEYITRALIYSNAQVMRTRAKK